MNQELVAANDPVMTVQELLSQADLVRNAIKERMQDGLHYGTIPGTKGKVLLKPGADLICLMFRLSTSYTVQTIQLAGEHREERVTCFLKTRGVSGLLVAEGLGVCSTREGKYRFRAENTGQLVPEEYWHHRDPDVIGGPQFSTRKVDGKWMVFHQVETTNPADVYHTVLAMARKRALVQAVLTATATSDAFEPDAAGDGGGASAEQETQRHRQRERKARSAPIEPSAESNDRRIVLLANLEDAAQHGLSALMEAWQELGENDRTIVGKDFGRIRDVAKEVGE